MSLQRVREDYVVATEEDDAEDESAATDHADEDDARRSPPASFSSYAVVVVDPGRAIGGGSAATDATTTRRSTAARQRRVGTVVVRRTPPPPPTLAQEMAVAGGRSTTTTAEQQRPGQSAVAVATTEEELDRSSAHEVSNNNSSNYSNSSHNNKHEAKWNAMLRRVVAYKEAHRGSTMVPQCYHEDPQLGRWVHYQRVEYWIYQSTGHSGKITPDRIRRLDDSDFVWDPQRAVWLAMFTKLQEFVQDHGHCRVPKGYAVDSELANWVRNQRLERVNQCRGRRTRLTAERFELLNGVGFQWSAAVPPKSKAAAQRGVLAATDETMAKELPSPPPLPTLGKRGRGDDEAPGDDEAVGEAADA